MELAFTVSFKQFSTEKVSACVYRRLQRQQQKRFVAQTCVDLLKES